MHALAVAHIFRQFTASTNFCVLPHVLLSILELIATLHAPWYEPQSSQMLVTVWHADVISFASCRSFGRAHCVGSEPQSKEPGDGSE